MKFKTGDRVRIIKVYYPLSIDILGKYSIIEVKNESIYLLDMKCYINKECIEVFDEKKR